MAQCNHVANRFSIFICIYHYLHRVGYPDPERWTLLKEVMRSQKSQISLGILYLGYLGYLGILRFLEKCSSLAITVFPPMMDNFLFYCNNQKGRFMSVKLCTVMHWSYHCQKWKRSHQPLHLQFSKQINMWIFPQFTQSHYKTAPLNL